MSDFDDEQFKYFASVIVSSDKVPENCTGCWFLTFIYHPCGCGLKHVPKSLFEKPICEVYDFTRYLLEAI